MSVAHPYRCVAQVQRGATLHNDVAGHGTVVVAEQRAPYAVVTGIDVIDATVWAVVHSPRKPTDQERTDQSKEKEGSTPHAGQYTFSAILP